MKSKHAHCACKLCPPFTSGNWRRKKGGKKRRTKPKTGNRSNKNVDSQMQGLKVNSVSTFKAFVFVSSFSDCDSWWFCGGRKICSESNHGLTRREKRPVMTLVRQCRLLVLRKLSTENSAQQHHIEKAEGPWCVLVAVMAEGEVLVGSFVKFGTAAQIPLLSEGGVTLLQCNTVTL